MRASTIIALLASTVAALPQNQPKASAPAPTQQAGGSGGGASCNFLSCATALGVGGAKCVDFAFGGSGRDCVKGVLDDIEHLPQPCADCLNALFLS